MWIVLTMAFVLVVYFTYLIFYPFKSIEFLQPFKVLNENSKVKRGGELLLEVEYIKYTEAASVVIRDIRCADGNRVTLTPTKSDVDKGEGKTVTSINIPAKISLGVCTYHSTIVHEINHFRVIETIVVSEPFEVIE